MINNVKPKTEQSQNSLPSTEENKPTTRPQPEIINSETLKKSIAILEQFEINQILSPTQVQFVHQLCQMCKCYFPTMKNKDNACKSCKEILCMKHRQPLNHHCSKLTPQYEKYLMAKNMFKTRAKAIKNKGY
jgi:hypothetical protein